MHILQRQENKVRLITRNSFQERLVTVRQIFIFCKQQQQQHQKQQQQQHMTTTQNNKLMGRRVTNSEKNLLTIRQCKKVDHRFIKI